MFIKCNSAIFSKAYSLVRSFGELKVSDIKSLMKKRIKNVQNALLISDYIRFDRITIKLFLLLVWMGRRTNIWVQIYRKCGNQQLTGKACIISPKIVIRPVLLN